MGCCASETNANDRPVGGLEKNKSGVMMGFKVPGDRKKLYANRPKIVLGYWKIRGLAQ